MHFLPCYWPRALALHWPIDGAHFKAEIVGGPGQHATRNHEQRHVEEVHATMILEKCKRKHTYGFRKSHSSA